MADSPVPSSRSFSAMPSTFSFWFRTRTTSKRRFGRSNPATWTIGLRARTPPPTRQPPRRRLAHPRRLLLAGHGGIHGRGGDPGLAEGIDLVFHQREERRNDDRQ